MQRSVNQNLNRRPNRTMLRRTLFLMAVCGILAFCVLAARLYVLQIRDHEKYEELAISQQLRETGASAERGTIYDCNMNILAMSANVENVYLSPAEIEMYDEDPELIAQKLSEILGVDYDSVLEKTRNTGSWYVTVAKKIEKETADKIRIITALTVWRLSMTPRSAVHPANICGRPTLTAPTSCLTSTRAIQARKTAWT